MSMIFDAMKVPGVRNTIPKLIKIFIKIKNTNTVLLQVKCNLLWFASINYEKSSFFTKVSCFTCILYTT